MRINIDSYIDNIVKDNAEPIICGGYESIADYIISQAEYGTGWYDFFDDAELDETGEPTEEQVEELTDYVKDSFGFMPFDRLYVTHNLSFTEDDYNHYADRNASDYKTYDELIDCVMADVEAGCSCIEEVVDILEDIFRKMEEDATHVKHY